MGVPGLYSFFDSKALGQRKSWSTRDAASRPAKPTASRSDSHDSSHRSWPESGSGTESGSSSNRQERYFIIDGNAYIHHLYCGQFEWIWGGQYSSFTILLTEHVRALQDCGFQLQILFDGPLPLQKLQTRQTRDTEKIQRMTRVVGDLEHYRVMGQDPLSHKAGGRGSSYFLIPPLVMEVALQTLRSLGVDLMVCDGEADGLVAQLALVRSMDENVVEAYAVSKDSDYFIYNTGSSPKGGYIPFDSLLVSTDSHSKMTTITATVYSQSTIAQHLGIKSQFLPLFASLAGNDYL
ncbi:MAG: PIN domain-like protein, partial [Benniella sp.]